MGQPYEQADQQWELPEIDPDLRARLKAEISRWGRVLVPMVVDEHDRIIDGTLRWEIAQELGIRDIPRVNVRGGTEQEFRSNFEQEDGATQGVRTMSGKIGA